MQLNDDLGDADRLVLLGHDSDAFNRWESAQRLVLQRLLGAVHGGGEPHLDEDLQGALGALLREPGLDPAFKALALTAPGESYIAEHLDAVDPQRIHGVAQQWRALLAERLHADWQLAFEANQVTAGYSPLPQQAGQRALANLALSMLCLHGVRKGDPLWPGRAYQRVKDAGNMTDRIEALMALTDAHSPLAARACRTSMHGPLATR